jgi:hypothetical protein
VRESAFTWTTGGRGLPIASSGTATYDLNAEGYPAEPSNATTIITEFEYIP